MRTNLEIEKGEVAKSRTIDRIGQCLCFFGTAGFTFTGVYFRDELVNPNGAAWQVVLYLIISSLVIVLAFVRWYFYGQKTRKPVAVKPINSVLPSEGSVHVR